MPVEVVESAGLPAPMLRLQADESRQQRRRIELAGHRFEIRHIARHRVKRCDITKAGGRC
jgi:hypothetical protein